MLYSLMHKKRYYIQSFLFVKSSKNIFIFYCILLDRAAHEITKEFWKNSHFENIWRPSEVTKLASANYKIIRFLAW